MCTVSREKCNKVCKDEYSLAPQRMWANTKSKRRCGWIVMGMLGKNVIASTILRHRHDGKQYAKFVYFFDFFSLSLDAQEQKFVTFVMLFATTSEKHSGVNWCFMSIDNQRYRSFFISGRNKSHTYFHSTFFSFHSIRLINLLLTNTQPSDTVEHATFCWFFFFIIAVEITHLCHEKTW